MSHGFNIVLVEPQIPVNTGSIGRTCLATRSNLHLIEPLGFKIDDSKLRRAGLDYWQHLHVEIYKNIDNFFETIPQNSSCVYFSKRAEKLFYNHSFKKGEYLFFGNETSGLPRYMVQSELSYRIPLYNDRVRSLNQANSVGIVLYEAIRQLGP